MAQERLPMRKIREILRLRWCLGYGVCQTATDPRHRPLNHTARVEQDPGGLLGWAAGVGEHAHAYMRRYCHDQTAFSWALSRVLAVTGFPGIAGSRRGASRLRYRQEVCPSLALSPFQE